MIRKKITNTESHELEQVFIEGLHGVFQAGIMLTNTSIYLFENSRETYSKNRHSMQYQIDFRDIIDLRLRDPQDIQEEVFILPKTSQLLADPCFQKKTCHVLRIYFRNNSTNQKECDILSNATSCLHRQIISLWQSSLCLESLVLQFELIESQYELAENYYIETLTSLRHSTEINDQIEILNEFAQEVVGDITLKKICFNSRELIVVLFNLCDTVVSLPSNQIKSVKSFIDQKQITETRIQQRLELFHAILRVFYSLFFSSECLDRRFAVINGDFTPLVLHSWIDLSTIDIQKRVCSIFNYKFEDTSDDLGNAVDLEIDTSFENISLWVPFGDRDFLDSSTSNLSPIRRSFSINERSRANSSEERPRLRSRANSIDNVSDDLLTPLRKRVQAQLVDQKMKKSLNLTTITQSIRDLQTLILSYICNSIYIGRSITRVKVSTPPKNFANFFTKHLGWDLLIEDILIRISDTLDDMLALEPIATRVKKRLRNKILQLERNSPQLDTSPLTFRERSNSEASDISVPNLSYVIDQERKRIPPSPPKKARRKDRYIKKMSGDDESNTIFETQEILLFNSCNFLHLLILENPKIRQFLLVEMDNYWFEIIHSLNLIIPRPDEDKYNHLASKKISVPKTSKSTSLEPQIPTTPIKSVPVSIKTTNNNISNGNGNGNKDNNIVPTSGPDNSITSLNGNKVSSSSTNLNFLNQLFRKDSENHDDDDGVIEIPEPIVEISVRERNLTYPLLFVRDYGPPLYSHLNRASWELIVLSRCFLEDIIKTLGVEVSLVSNIPVADDDNEVNITSQISGVWKLDSTIPIRNTSIPNSNNLRYGNNINRDRENDVPIMKLPTQIESPRSDYPSKPYERFKSYNKSNNHNNNKDSDNNNNNNNNNNENKSNGLPRLTIRQRQENAKAIPYDTNNENRIRRGK